MVDLVASKGTRRGDKEKAVKKFLCVSVCRTVLYIDSGCNVVGAAIF